MIIKNLKDAIQGKASFGNTRSNKWPAVRKAHLKNNPTCAACGGKSKLEVHHIKPFYIEPSLELDLTNLITLCESKSYGVVCHLHYGHLGNYKKVNPDVVKDSAIWKKKLLSPTAEK
jgi:hypothetical protein